jgi:hypothetical protein
MPSSSCEDFHGAEEGKVEITEGTPIGGLVGVLHDKLNLMSRAVVINDSRNGDTDEPG